MAKGTWDNAPLFPQRHKTGKEVEIGPSTARPPTLTADDESELGISTRSDPYYTLSGGRPRK